ncbi:DNA-binding transcriptional regulator, XRE-family HTH domain [Thalassovita litoralis]|uniref:DNA-binding transcriptional regulator, XRE-family HTH domain n=1 Tax=Thalassovita litoralis TaxID=1010611 RepID=A0A521E9A9_9RHOB|nr:helix-turn-helix transcriptional regulator [Thalassovita litoralis]SMO80494.1 DNA-binding transcriptional regulator, XRE-family HTH domain [Thalassovita litoralis]
MKRQNEDLLIAFSVVLSQLRQRASLTQEELAERADVSTRFVSFLETARRQPSLSALYALSSGLGIRLQDLVIEVERQYEQMDSGVQEPSEPQ